MAGDLSFEIVKKIGVISESKGGWTKELNLIAWNGRAPKYDIRDWDANHEKMGKGITLSEEELKQLVALVSGGEVTTLNTDAEETVSSKPSSLNNSSDNGISVDDLMKYWDSVNGRAPEPIRELLINSSINEFVNGTVGVIVPKGNVFNELMKPMNRMMLNGYIGQLLGRNVEVEVVESAYQ